MGQRVDFQVILEELLGSGAVFFQPPTNFKMVYPCIVYRRDDVRPEHANNKLYQSTTRYQVTVIDRNPDSVIPDKVAQLPMTNFDRFFTADNLNHDVFNVYF